MPAIYQYGKLYSGGSGNSMEKTISYEEYTSLTPAEKNNGTTYFVPDYPLAETVVDEKNEAVVFVPTSETLEVVSKEEIIPIVSVLGDIENEEIPVGDGTVIGAVKAIDETVKTVEETLREDLDEHIGDTEVHVTTAERAKWSQMEEDIAVERARIDVMQSLPEGSTSGDAALEDIKVGYDGTVWDTPGNAVRGQVSQLSNEIGDVENDIIKEKSFDFVDIFTTIGAKQGVYVQETDGTEVVNSDISVTDYIDLSKYCGELKMIKIVEVGHQGAFFDKNKNYVSGYHIYSSEEPGEYSVTIPNNARYIRISYITDYTNNYYCIAKTKNSEVVDGFLSDKNIFTTIGAKQGVYVQETDGTEVVNSDISVTDYIDVGMYNKITMNRPKVMTHQGAFYDKDKNYVSGYIYRNSNIGNEFGIAVPTNAKYIRISYITIYADNYYANAKIDIDKFVESVLQTEKGLFYGKKMNCLGDSITYGYIPDNGSQMSKPYPSIIKNKLGLAECRNYGISGSTLAVNGGNYQPMSVRYVDMDNDADIVSVFGGTNDYGRAIYSDLGTINDTTNTTIYGALNILCDGLIEKYPRAFIFFITPMRRNDKTGNNDGGYSLESVSNAIKEVAYKYNLPVLDLYSFGGFHVEKDTFRAIYSGNDKLHPSQDFVIEHLAPMIQKFIESHL